MAGKNLILSIIYGLNVSECKVFIESARRHINDTDVVFFYENVKPRTLEYLKRHDVILIPFSRKFPFIDECTLDDKFRELEQHLHQLYVYPMLLRNLLFDAFLRRHTNYEKVLTSDVTDVVFQADPFQYEGKLHCFLESDKKHLLNEDVNRFWLQKTYANEFEKFKSKRISCAGVVFGSRKGMLSYFEAYKLELSRMLSLNQPELYDQPIHNAIVHFNNIEGLQLVEDEQGVVCTQSYYKPFDMSRFSEGYVASSGAPIPVLHQYNRVAVLDRYFNSHYKNRLLGMTKFYKKIRSIKNRITRRFRANK